MIKWNELKERQKLGLGIAIIFTLAALWTFSPNLKPMPTIDGTYVSKTAMDMSTIVITQKEKGVITCVWDKMVTNEKGVVKENRLTLEGTVDGKDIELSVTIPGRKPIVVDATGVREKQDIRLSLSMDGRVFYTGLYEPVDTLGLAAATSEFTKKSSELAKAWQEKLDLRSTGGKSAADQIITRRKMIDQSNLYARRMNEFTVKHKEIEAYYQHNTASMKDYLQNVHRIPGAQNAGVRSQLLVMMRGILESTQTMQDKQNAFADDYVRIILPFFDSLSKQQKICADARAQGKPNKEEEDLCALAIKLQDAMAGSAKDLQAALNEVIASFRAELDLQSAMIDEAKKVQ